MMALKESEFVLEDFISIMPDNVITNILERLPIQDAVMTSILSRDWRFKWTMLRQLIFDFKFFDYLMVTKGVRDYGRILSKVLLHVKGPITKFVLCLMDDEDYNHWILFLSRNGIKDLTLINMPGRQVKLPTHLFSCLELKHLKLQNCHFNLPPSFHGFPNLLSLDLYLVQVGRNDLGELITRCPLLEILNFDYMNSIVKVKLLEIAKLENLKILSLSLCNLDTATIVSSHSIFELVGFLPKLQDLNLDFQDCKLTENYAKKTFPTDFPCLKTLKLSRIDSGNGIMLSCAFELIRSFPNLQNLEITTIQCDADPFPEVEYNTLGLRDVMVSSIEGSQNEVCLIKNLLACSPLLEKIVIIPQYHLSPHEQLIFARKLLKLHRASPVVDIDLYSF